MSDAAAAEWRSIVAVMPADWFTQEMWPLLSVLCNANAICKRIFKELETAAVGSEKFAKLSRLQAQYITTISRVSSKLRLTAQSRHTVHRARKATKDAVKLQGVGRPWEITG
jgi:hypothetical protein